MPFLFAAGLLSLKPFPAPAQTALQLFHEMQMALGGAQKIAAIRDFDETVRTDALDRQGQPSGTVRKRVRWISPNYLRIDQSGPYDTYVLFFDGKTGWEIMPDKSFKDLSGGELKFAENYLRRLDLTLWLADRDPTNTFSSPSPNVIVIAPDGDKSRSTAITLDPVTHLPIKEAGTSYSNPSHPVSAYTLLDEWRTVDGVKFPGRIRNVHAETMFPAITVEAMRVNCGIKLKALSAKPPDLKPVMSGN